MRRIRRHAPLLFGFFGLFGIMGCTTSYEENYEYDEPAEITVFSVPDSASSASIPVTISAILGRTTASSLKEIRSTLLDSLFHIVVRAKRVEKYGVQYEEKDITLDTTLILTTDSQRTGLHYFRTISSTGDTLRDTTMLY